MTPDRAKSRAQHFGGDAGAARLPEARTANGASSSRPTATIPARIRPVPTLSRRAGRRRIGTQDRGLSAADAKRAARRLAAVPGRRLRREREREGLFRAQDDRRFRRCPAHGAGARGDPFARRRGARQRLHQADAGAVRLHSVARGAGDADRDHAVPEMVSIPSRQDFLLEPHRHRPAAGADGTEAAGAKSEKYPDRRTVSRPAGDARTGAQGAAAERGAVLVLPRRRQRAALGRADVFQMDAAARDRQPRWRGSASGSTARTASARSFRRWRTA